MLVRKLQNPDEFQENCAEIREGKDIKRKNLRGQPEVSQRMLNSEPSTDKSGTERAINRYGRVRVTALFSFVLDRLNIRWLCALTK